LTSLWISHGKTVLKDLFNDVLIQKKNKNLCSAKEGHNNTRIIIKKYLCSNIEYIAVMA
jgi:hypothetical protein